jgi:hypothetical protein
MNTFFVDEQYFKTFLAQIWPQRKWKIWPDILFKEIVSQLFLKSKFLSKGLV